MIPWGTNPRISKKTAQNAPMAIRASKRLPELGDVGSTNLLLLVLLKTIFGAPGRHRN